MRESTAVTLCIQTMAVNCLHFDFVGCIFSKAVYKAKDRMVQSKEGTRKVMVVVAMALVAAILISSFDTRCHIQRHRLHPLLHCGVQLQQARATSNAACLPSSPCMSAFMAAKSVLRSKHEEVELQFRACHNKAHRVRHHSMYHARLH
jgi:hypothetical protein